jgi:hypothetical protein
MSRCRLESGSAGMCGLCKNFKMVTETKLKYYSSYYFAFHQESHGSVHAIEIALESKFEVVLRFLPLQVRIMSSKIRGHNNARSRDDFSGHPRF